MLVPGGAGPSSVLQFGEVAVEPADHELKSGDIVQRLILPWVGERRQIMRDDFRVYDADTHVNPAAEVLERYVDPSFRPRLVELAPYRRETGEGLHHYSFGRKFYRRVLGEAAPREDLTGRESNWRGGKLPRPGVQNDQAENRVRDMDVEGTDVHFLIPGSFMSLVGLEDPVFEVGLIRAYHRHMADF
jgi:hypothetical protein